MRGLILFAILATFFVSAPTARSAMPGEPSFRLEAFMIESMPREVRVESDLLLNNSEKVRDELRNGAQMVFTCTGTLVRVRTLLTNETLGTLARSAQLRHDPLIREFLLYQEGKPLLRSKRLDELLRTFWQAESLVFQPVAPLETGETYRVNLQLTLQHSQVPPWLEKALFFWSWDVTPPLSVEQDFVY